VPGALSGARDRAGNHVGRVGQLQPSKGTYISELLGFVEQSSTEALTQQVLRCYNDTCPVLFELS